MTHEEIQDTIAGYPAMVLDLDMSKLTDDQKVEADLYILSSLKEAVLLKRNRMLKDTDWTQVQDVPSNIRDAFTEYRQLLRDLPSTIDWNVARKWSDVKFPTYPTV